MNMTVAKLIEKLSKYPPNTPIVFVGSSIDVSIKIPSDDKKIYKTIATFDGNGKRQKSKWANSKGSVWNKYK